MKVIEYKPIIKILFTITIIHLYSISLFGIDIQPIGVRNDALGKTGAAVGSDIASIYYNPANLLLSRYSHLYFQYTDMTYDLYNQFVFGYLHLFSKKSALGLNLNVKRYSSLQEYDDYGEYKKNFSKQDNIFNMATSFKFQEQFYYGLKLKIANNSFYNYSTTYFYLDLGILYTPVWLDNFNMGLSLQNLQSGENIQDKDPFNIKTGVSYEINLNKHTFLISADYNHNSLIYPLFGAGLEYSISIFRMGLGYNEKDGLCSGLGFKYDAYRVDFGYTYNEIFRKYSAGFTFYFQPPKIQAEKDEDWTSKKVFIEKYNDYFFEGLDCYYKDNFQKAIKIWHRALSINSGNEKIKSWIEKAEKLEKEKLEREE